MKFSTHISIVEGIGLLLPFPRDVSLEIKKDVNYMVEIKEPKKRRSLTANAYCWVLCQKLAEELSKNGQYYSRNDVYKQAIEDCQAFQYVAVQTEHTDDFKRKWESKGIGWIARDVGSCKNFDGRTFQVFHGSSSYNTQEMARLIDRLVDECKQLGIETKPQAEIDSLLKEWSPIE